MENNPQIYDAFNVLISVGDSVIYNLSGELSKGTVTRLYEGSVKRYSGNVRTYTITIKNSKTGKDSKVKNPKSLCVVDKAYSGSYQIDTL